MYKVCHLPSGQEITILDPLWRAQLTYLRQLSTQDLLVCPGCEQPVTVRAGTVRQWHFAHKHLANCPYETQSPALLAARAVLYTFLRDQFLDAVSVEHLLEDAGLPRPIDCWLLQNGQAFAYWIIDRRLPPEQRDSLLQAFRAQNIRVTWVFLADFLRGYGFQKERVDLTTTERAFLQQTAYDCAWQTHYMDLGSTLHYFLTETRQLVTYRNLVVEHPPQRFIGVRLESALADVTFDQDTGGFVHSGETKRLADHLASVAVEKNRAVARVEKARRFLQGDIDSSADEPAHPAAAERPFGRAGVCRVCGVVTTDWVQFDGRDATCICRDCRDAV